MAKDLDKRGLEPDEIIEDALEDDTDYSMGEFIIYGKAVPIIEIESSTTGRTKIKLATGNWFELDRFIIPGEMGVTVRFEDTLHYKRHGDSAIQSIYEDMTNGFYGKRIQGKTNEI